MLYAQIPAGCSFTWRIIASATPTLRMGVRWRVGNGANIRVWWDAGIPRDSFFYCIRRNNNVPDDLMVVHLLTSERRWNAVLITKMCMEEDARLILNIPLFENDLPVGECGAYCLQVSIL